MLISPIEISERLASTGIPVAPPAPIGTFANALLVDNLLYVSGQGPVEIDGSLHTGKVGRDVSVEEAYAHARLVGMNILSAVQAELGGWARFRRVVKVLGMVNAVDTFCDHPAVINGCSDLFMQVFGPAAGRHARSSFGVASLPRQITVEVEAVFLVHPE